MRWWSFLVDNAHHLRRTLKIFVIYFVRIQKLWTTVCYNKPSIFDKCIVYILKINGRFNCHFDLKTKNFISHSHVIILIPSSTDDTNTGLTLVQLLPWNLTNQTISKKDKNWLTLIGRWSRGPQTRHAGEQQRRCSAWRHLWRPLIGYPYSPAHYADRRNDVFCHVSRGT